MKFLNTLIITILSASLTACGGGGGGSSTGTGDNAQSNNGGSNPGNGTRNVLFVGDYGNLTMAAFTTLAPTAGTSIAANVLNASGSSKWFGLAFDTAHDRLYASTGTQIAVFDHASALSGSVSPAKLLTPNFSFVTLLDLMLDKSHDRLYLGYTVGLGYELAVFDNVSTLNGGILAPTRVIKNLRGGSDFAIDTKRGILFNGGITSNIYIYTNIDQVNGFLPNVAPVKTTLPINGTRGMAYDDVHDRLYLGVPGTGVAYIDGASSGNTKATVLSAPNAGTSYGLAYDSANDRLYAGIGNSAYIFNNAYTFTNGANALMVSGPSSSKIAWFAF